MKSPQTRSLPTTKLVVAIILCAVSLSGLLPPARGEASGWSRRTATRPQGLTVAGVYRQTNLVSDVPGVGLIEDPLLLGPVGVAVSSDSPFWVANNAGNFLTLYQGDVNGSPLIKNPGLSAVGFSSNLPVIIPPLPTAIVSNTTGDFKVSGADLPAVPAQFLIASGNGTIHGWHPSFGSATFVARASSGGNYTGMAIGSNAAGNLLYATDFLNGKIDVFDKDFNPTTVPGNFAGTAVPSSFAPFNIQNIGGSLYVTYASFSSGVSGFVRKFDTNGVRDAAFAIDNGPLDAPYGMTLAPADFGAFSNMLLVGNFRDNFFTSSINAFNPATGAVIGSMVDEGGANYSIHRLGALVFGNGTNGGDPTTLYFAAGVLSVTHGLLCSLKPASLATSTIKFSTSESTVSEAAGHTDIEVTRTGDTSKIATVNYATVDSEGQRSDYEIALGKLTFNPGETSKTFRVLIVDDKQFAGGTSVTLQLWLSNATGAGLTNPRIARLNLMDDEFDTPGHPPNSIDDPQLFVRQHYADFLNRVPDAAGLDFWVNQITLCGTDEQCIELKRINVSAAFFLSIEFQRTGMLAYLTERAAFGGLPRYGAFMRDVQAMQRGYVFGAADAEVVLEANKRAFFDEFVTRPDFVARYGHLSNEIYVSTLMSTGGVNTTTGRLFLTRLTGAQVVPPASTPATGLGVARIGQNAQVSFDLSFSGLTSPQISAHLHGPAVAGENAPVVFTLPNGEFTDHVLTLPAQVQLDLGAGRLYFDIHTQNNPDGELRGQLPNSRFLFDVLVRALDDGTITRAQALRLIAEDLDFRQTQFNQAFVLMEYFGYLRRNPDDPPDNNLAGFNFWLNKLNSFDGNFVSSDMVKAFIKSTEYRSRFGPP